MSSQVAYPVRVEAELDSVLSRWLWIVKWLLAIPHYVVLAFLWVAFVLVGVAAFFAIVISGRYPRALFDFNVGVLRWNWRVAYYAYGALGTDRYPPFTLKEVPDYPVHLDIDYPEKLSRGLVLVKWWLLAIPHYIIVGLLVGGAWIMTSGDDWDFVGFGLIGLLAVVAGFALAFTGAYPRSIFDLLLGLNRWVIRVAAYAGLMTDVYPPFRLDMGPHEPGADRSGADREVPPDALAATSSASGGHAAGWSAGSILAVIFGTLMVLGSLGLLAAGGVGLWADRTQRENGFVTSSDVGLATDARAIVSDDIEIYAEGPDWVLPDAILGDARLRATSDRSLFVGVARTDDVERYLDDVAHAVVSDLLGSDGERLRGASGEATPTPPSDQDFWIASSEGSGTRSVAWEVANGSWTLVVMNADASAGVSVEADLGAEAPVLGTLSVAMLVAGGVILLLGIVLIVTGTGSSRRTSP